MTKHLPIAALLFLVVPPVAGQTPDAERPVSVQVGAGTAVPFGPARDASGIGWDVSVAAGARVNDLVNVRVGYLYARFRADTAEVIVGKSGPWEESRASVRGKVQTHVGFADVVLKRPLEGRDASVFLLAGPAIALRRVAMTGSAQGWVDACLPQWLQCDGRATSFDRAIGIRRATSPGATLGVGLEFDAGLNARVLVEARVVYLRGPRFTDSAGDRRSASATFVPIMVGLRF